MKKLLRLMTHALIGAAAATLPFGGAAQAQTARATAPNVETFTLDNGLDVVVVPDRRAPVVTHMIWYRAGSADEPPGKSGIAHFLEHLMFKGTKKHPAGEFSNQVSELGGQENAFTSYDYTAYYQRVPKTALKTVMEFEADRMTGLVLTDEVVLPERDVILEERRMRTDSDPSAQLSEAVSAALWMNHPYGLPIIGWEHEMQTLNRDDAIAFYERFYTPNNAILVIAGDVDKAEVETLARETYGAVPRRFATPVRNRPTEPPQLAARQVALADARVRQPSVSRVYLSPSYRTAEGEQAYALDLLSVILGGGSTSRLYRSLVVEQGIAASAGAYYSGTALDANRFAVYALPRPGVELTALEKAIDAEIGRLTRDGVTPEELDRAKTRLIAETIYDLDNQTSLARTFGVALTTGMSVEDVVNWPERIKAVTAEDVAAAARTVLVTRQSVTGLLEPAPTGDRP
ncbi:pitrilysin family protein [Terrihabitans rhizophilus]|uniref:Pitrilysin family protein n=1 Tax=Terrihabitans rhizophilus TaxID=3092662 RepID=A0ABU4RT98_9HYPH|nr:pitrilysin family protein [Terrihabitans sp. PJ23]MDX6806905.1 pitrilysin family protein [Terrihabitans sp. PJ23]